MDLIAVGGVRSVALSWETPPATFNRIERYQVRYLSGSQQYTPWATIPNSNYRTTRHTLTGLADETAYTIQVRAVNSSGGGASAQQVATTQAPPVNAPRDSDGKPTFVAYDASAHESGDGTDSSMSFKVQLLNAADDATAMVDYATADGSAKAGSDYTATSGTLTFEPGGASSQIVTVPVKDDTAEDSGETFSLRLSNPQGGAQLHASRSTATGTILNEEATGVSASFPASRFASRLHKGADDRPQVVVAFSEAVAAFAANTPSVQVMGGTVSSMQAHTEDGLAHAWLFFLTPDGDGDVTFALVADAACDSGGHEPQPDDGQRRHAQMQEAPERFPLAGALGTVSAFTCQMGERIYTQAAKGEIVITGCVLVGGVVLLRAGAFVQDSFRLAYTSPRSACT